MESGNYEDFKESIFKHSIHFNPMAHDALPELKKSKVAIVTIGSKIPGYATAKGVRNALTQEWAAELLPYNIRVNTAIA